MRCWIRKFSAELIVLILQIVVHFSTPRHTIESINIIYTDALFRPLFFTVTNSSSCNNNKQIKYFCSFVPQSFKLLNPTTSITLTSADVNGVHFGQNALTAYWAELEKNSNRKKWSQLIIILSKRNWMDKKLNDL